MDPRIVVAPAVVVPEWLREDAEFMVAEHEGAVERGEADDSLTFGQALRFVCDDADERGTSKQRREVLRFLLAVGVYRSVTNEEYERAEVWCSNGRNRKAATYPKLDGGRVTFESWGPLESMDRPAGGAK